MPGVKPHAVAVVDDDDGVREYPRCLLQATGRKVAVFAAATDFLNANHWHIACLLLDQQMSIMTGLEPAQRLPSANVAIPILLTTGAMSPAIVCKPPRQASCEFWTSRWMVVTFWLSSRQSSEPVRQAPQADGTSRPARMGSSQHSA